jgi:hypothetical protein
MAPLATGGARLGGSGRPRGVPAIRSDVGLPVTVLVPPSGGDDQRVLADRDVRLRLRQLDRLAGEALSLLNGGAAQTGHCCSTGIGAKSARAASETYASRNPNGYCGLGGTGVSCPIGLTASS